MVLALAGLPLEIGILLFMVNREALVGEENQQNAPLTHMRSTVKCTWGLPFFSRYRT